MDTLKVLFVDDDTDLGNLVSMVFTSLGYQVHFQSSLFGIEQVIEEFSPSVIVLDVEVGSENGIEKARGIIAKFPDIPVLFVSSHTDISYITEGISVGGMNYIRKPFKIKELEAYIVRFAKKRCDNNSEIITMGRYSLDTSTGGLSYNNQLVKQLSPLEKNALLLLVKHKNSLVPTELLVHTLWGAETSGNQDASIHNLISKLRKILNRDDSVSIMTLKKKGYQMRVKK